MAERATYHHGDLRAALIEAALAVIAENGVAALSVAQAARRAGVSSAAPYRHFAGRQALLAAAATRGARQLAAELSGAADLSGAGGLSGAAEQAPDRPGRAVEALAATAGAYVRFVVQRRAGFDLIFADELAELNDPGLAEAGRAVMDVLLPLALEITGGDADAALTLLEQHTAAAHGYAVLHLSGFLRRRAASLDDVAARAEAASRLLATAAQQA